MSDHLRPSDSAHPSDETLAGLVDGTLTVAERAELQAHLDGCERCRAEVGLADSAAKALRSLPELDAPWGLGRAAIEEAKKGVRPARARRFAAAAGIAAAAVLAVGISVAVLRGPQHPSPASEAGAQTSGATSSAAGTGGSKLVPAQAPSPLFLKSSKNYSADDVAELATRYSALRAPGSPKTVNPLASTVPAPTQPGTAGASGATGTTGTSGAVSTSGTSKNSGAFSSSGVSGSTGTSGPVAGGSVDDLAAVNPVQCLDTAAGYAKSTT
ncbi:MAG TPA: anti-sigma factor, partial [Actinomycetota bacterium]|nr:anti-sigma factor [Actinomycetota bacterium]